MKVFMISLGMLVLCTIVTGRSVSYKSLEQNKMNSVKDVTALCFACRAVFTMAEQMLQQVTNVTSESAMEKLITETCKQFPIQVQLCSVLGTLLGEVAWTLETKSPKEYCGMVNYCPKSYSNKANRDLTLHKKILMNEQPKPSAARNVPTTCIFCQAAVFAFEEVVVPHVNSQAQMIGEVTKLCDKLTNNSVQCVAIGYAVGHELWQVKQYPPQKACVNFKLCPAITFRQAVGFGYGQSALHNTNGIECSACKDVVSAAKFLIISNEGWIANEIIQLVCDRLPPESAQACKTAISGQLPDILEKYLNPDLVCNYLKLC